MMDSIWLVLGLALPALGNFSGGLAAEASRTTGRRLITPFTALPASSLRWWRLKSCRAC